MLVQQQTNLIQQNIVVAKKAQPLRQVFFFQPTLMRVRHGSKLIWLNEQKHIANDEDIIIVPAGISLSLINQPNAHGYTCEVLSIDQRLIQHFKLSYPAIVDVGVQFPSRICAKLTPVITQQWDETLSAIASNEPAELLHHRVEGLLLALTMSGLSAALICDRTDSVTQRAQKTLLLQPSKEWTVEMLASQLQMGSSTLRRKLDLEKTSFREILDQVRLNAALGLIQTTKDPIGVIAQRCGYNSASRFSARFFQQYGIKPLQLRATAG